MPGTSCPSSTSTSTSTSNTRSLPPPLLLLLLRCYPREGGGALDQHPASSSSSKVATRQITTGTRAPDGTIKSTTPTFVSLPWLSPPEPPEPGMKKKKKKKKKKRRRRRRRRRHPAGRSRGCTRRFRNNKPTPPSRRGARVEWRPARPCAVDPCGPRRESPPVDAAP